MTPTSLVVGCGYLGQVLAARLARAGHRLLLTTRSPERAAALRGQFGDVVQVLDVAGEDSAEPLALLAAQATQAFVLLTPSALQEVGGTLAPLQRIQSALDASPSLGLALLSSSTAVYGDHAGQVVTAETPCTGGGGNRENRLLAIETLWGQHPARRVVRLAGLYGPGRIIGERALRAGAPIDGDPTGWLNLIHVVDAANLLVHCLGAAAATVELGSDGTPVTRRAYYDYLAASLGCAPPTYSGIPTPRGGASRRCAARTTRERTGWRPMFRDFRTGLCSVGPSLIPQERSQRPGSHPHTRSDVQS